MLVLSPHLSRVLGVLPPLCPDCMLYRYPETGQHGQVLASDLESDLEGGATGEQDDAPLAKPTRKLHYEVLHAHRLRQMCIILFAACLSE